MDKFIKLLDLLRKDNPISVHICYMGGRKTWSITVLEDSYKDFVVKVEENANVDEGVRSAMKQLINRYSEEVINELLQRI